MTFGKVYQLEWEKCEFHPKTENNWDEFRWIPVPIWPQFFADLKKLWHEMIPNQMQRAIMLCFQLSTAGDELLYIDVQQSDF